MTLKWSKLSKKQRKKITGIAVYRNGKLVKRLKKTATSFKNTGLKANTAYKYQLKTYKKIKKGKKYKYKYSNVSSKKAVTTEEASGSTSTSPSTGGSSGTSTPNIKQTIHEEYSYGEVLSTNEPSVYLIWHGGRYVNMVVYVYRDGEQIAGPLDEDTYYYGDNDVKWSTAYTYTIKTVLGEYEAVSDPVTITTPDEPEEEEELTIDDGVYFDVSDMYTYINEWRQDSSNWWYATPGGGTGDKTYLTESEIANLVTLVRDPELEAAAQQRAKEQLIAYWYAPWSEGDGSVKHTRYNYKTKTYESWKLTIQEAGFDPFGENISYGDSPSNVPDGRPSRIKAIIYDGWAEADNNDTFMYQGHRRMMLSMQTIYNPYTCKYSVSGVKPIVKVGFGGFRVGSRWIVAMELAW